MTPIAYRPGPALSTCCGFSPLDLIDNTAVAVAAIGEIPGLGRALPDYRPLAAVSLITPYPGLITVQQIGQHRAVGHIGRRRHRRVDQFGAATRPRPLSGTDLTGEARPAPPLVRCSDELAISSSPAP